MSEVKTNKITSLASNNDITLDPDGTGDTIIASGNLGVGTTSPDHTLTVSASTSPVLEIEQTSGGPYKTNILLNGNDTEFRGSSGNIEFYTGNDDGASSTERMRVSSDGKIRLANTAMNFDSSSNTATGLTTGTSGLTHICTGSGNAQLVCQKTSPSGDENMIVFLRGSTSAGQIRTNSSNEVLYQNNSDHRLKENVSDMTGAIARVKQLTPKRFSYISDPDSTIVDGFLAHEAQTVVPNAVSGTHNEVDADGNAIMQGFDQSKLVPLLTGALQEAIAKIEALEARVTALEDA